MGHAWCVEPERFKNHDNIAYIAYIMLLINIQAMTA